MSSGRVRPQPDAVTEPFWDRAADGVLVAQWCSACARYQLPPRATCGDCGASDLEFRPVSGEARLASWTTTHYDLVPTCASARPYVSVVVELVEQPGLYLLGDFIDRDVDPNDLVAGRRMVVSFEPVDEDLVLPQFRFATPTAAP